MRATGRCAFPTLLCVGVSYYEKGVTLVTAEAEETDECHQISIERIEDEYFVQIKHDMTKQHYISFAAAVSSDRIQLEKFYPEGNAEARFKMNGVKRILFYCNRDGLFYVNPK